MLFGIERRRLLKALEREDFGFIYEVEEWVRGRMRARECLHNLMPNEGRTYLMNAALHGSSQLTTFYVGLFEANYTPVLGDTMALFPAAATETTAYAEATRPEWVEATEAAGVITNAASVAVFTFNAAKTIYGGFISSNSGKGATSGTLVSAGKFATAKAMDSLEVLRITASLTGVQS